MSRTKRLLAASLVHAAELEVGVAATVALGEILEDLA